MKKLVAYDFSKEQLFRQKNWVNQKSVLFDPDSSLVMWRHYNIIYPVVFSRYNEFDSSYYEMKKTGESVGLNLIRNRAYAKHLSGKFSIAGDVDFNFNDKRYDSLKKSLNEEDRRLLDSCYEMHHSFENCSLMLMTGSMQLTKGAGSIFKGDLFNVHLQNMNMFFSIRNSSSEINFINLQKKLKSEKIFLLSKRNAKNLYEFLNQFTDIYDYCKQIHLLDTKEIVKKVLECKIEKIDKETLVDYMRLAESYWEHKQARIKQIYETAGLRLESVTKADGDSLQTVSNKG